jgi:hypothetical protein
MFAIGLWLINASLVVGTSKNKNTCNVEEVGLPMDWTTMALILGNFNNELFCISLFHPCFLL